MLRKVMDEIDAVQPQVAWLNARTAKDEALGGPLAALLPPFPRRLQFPIPVGLNILLVPSLSFGAVIARLDL